MSENKQMVVDYTLWRLIVQVADILLLAREYEVKPYGITAVQVKVLGLLTNTPHPVRAADLAKRLQKQHNGVVSLLERMIKNGLLYELADTQKERKRIFGVTELGRSTYEKTKNMKIIGHILDHLNTQQKEQMIELMSEIRGNAIKELSANDFYLAQSYPYTQTRL